MTSTSAPGKLILLGEHAVVFGKPAIALALDLRLRCKVEPSSALMVNGQLASEKYHAYIMTAVREFWDEGPLAIDINSDVPSGSGLGSSAAVSVAVLGALAQMQDEFSQETVARRAFMVESLVQGRASPIDTSVSAHGRGIFIDSVPGPEQLWDIQRDTRKWFIHHCQVPEMNMVVGYTGIKGPTGPLVSKVKRYVDHSNFAKDIIDEIGVLTLEGLIRVKKKDLVGLGALMTRDHNLLAILGVSSPELQKLVDAALPYSYGAKLTGAGGGGSMVALTDRVDQVCEAIRSRGGTPFVVHTGGDGVRVEKEKEIEMENGFLP